MKGSGRLLAACLVLGLVAAGCAPPASQAGGDPQQQVVTDATATVQEMKAATGFARSGLLERAKAVMIVPRAVKVAFGIGGEGGQAVLLVRNARGWSNPAFYTVASGSVGPQIGVRETATVLLIMTDRALRTFLQDSNVTAGAQANLTAAQYDLNRVAQLGGQDVILWTDSSGLFAGGSLSAQGFTQNAAYDRAYYGRDATAAEITRGAVRNPAADQLRAVL